MKKIKFILYRLLGSQRYLRLVSSFFFLFYSLGLLKRNPIYYIHYFVKKLIKKGDYIIDIGANLGYYSKIFSDLVGRKGKVYAVEPLPIYQKVLKRNTAKKSNIQLIPYALGKENGKVQMGVPGNDVYQHGRNQVLTENKKITSSTEVEIKKASTLFSDLERLDYIKCDVEGFEMNIIPELEELLLKFKPILQIEIDSKNKPDLCSFLENLGYSFFSVEKSNLIPESMDTLSKTKGDLIFIHELNRLQ